jgi:hypothetical protein
MAKKWQKVAEVCLFIAISFSKFRRMPIGRIFKRADTKDETNLQACGSQYEEGPVSLLCMSISSDGKPNYGRSPSVKSLGRKLDTFL